MDPRDRSRAGEHAIVAALHVQLRPSGIVLMNDDGGDRTQTVQAHVRPPPAAAGGGRTFMVPPVLALA
ncbi:hypothetical protein ACIA8K_29830 [Catenuloplanes sp. NPDC051500]|uniref:hypothetical protein n=1 Tax=Catenuloplanes sp. NPDC051500 TaxID=3363959 RepID=UPI00379D7C2E